MTMYYLIQYTFLFFWTGNDKALQFMAAFKLSMTSGQVLAEGQIQGTFSEPSMDTGDKIGQLFHLSVSFKNQKMDNSFLTIRLTSKQISQLGIHTILSYTGKAFTDSYFLEKERARFNTFSKTKGQNNDRERAFCNFNLWISYVYRL